MDNMMLDAVRQDKTPPLCVTQTPLLTGEDTKKKRDELKAYFNSTFELYEHLFDLIRDDASYYSRPEPLRHPLIFYFGHTATFFINKLILAQLIDERINSEYESMFAVGVDEMSWDDLNEAHYDWPAVDAVRRYRKEVQLLVNSVIDTMPLSLPIKQSDPAWVILMGIEHERIHLETSSVIMRMLPVAELRSLPSWQSCMEVGEAPENGWITFQQRSVLLGKPTSDVTYGWDNEYGQKEVDLDVFDAATHLISNQAYLAFIEAGGYQTPRYWTEEGQRWLDYTKATMPRFWLKRDGAYWQRNLTEEMPLPLNWPVEVNYLEAKAYCQWQSEVTGRHIRLPIEAEWMVLRSYIESDQPNWLEAPGNLNLEHFCSSCPIDRFGTEVKGTEVKGTGAKGTSDKGATMFDIVGNVWQWTETPIDAYSGFNVHPLYDDFSTPTFDGKHNLIKGGSWISTGNESIRYSRYAFRRHFFQHAGFRCVASDKKMVMEEKVNTYETDALVSQYLEFHYGDQYFNVENYPHSCVETLMGKIAASVNRGRALDIGCAVGRATFELARYFDHVDGIDFSARFIQCGHELKERGSVRYTIPTEGDLVDYKERSLEAFDLTACKERVEFIQGDATNLKGRFNDYNLVFAGNLLDRLAQPERFLRTIGDRMSERGWLVLTSPYTWLEEFTEKEAWIGGFKRDGENYTTLMGLKESLSDQFELMDTLDIPFVIRETERKFQHTVAQMTIWRKRS